MPEDPALLDHKAWIGYLQQDGLVVSAAALIDAQAVLDTHALPLQQRFLPFVEEVEQRPDEPVPVLRDFLQCARGFLG
ncbi:MAG: hypothetical protein HZA54_04725, partial [Planctomycetes bacterium]|nr:hypothetical protein [Planctomycetota bacterium]